MSLDDVQVVLERGAVHFRIVFDGNGNGVARCQASVVTRSEARHGGLLRYPPVRGDIDLVVERLHLDARNTAEIRLFVVCVEGHVRLRQRDGLVRVEDVSNRCRGLERSEDGVLITSAVLGPGARVVLVRVQDPDHLRDRSVLLESALALLRRMRCTADRPHAELGLRGIRTRQLDTLGPVVSRV